MIASFVVSVTDARFALKRSGVQIPPVHYNKRPRALEIIKRVLHLTKIINKFLLLFF